MNSQGPNGPNDVSPEAMQARIQQARREAETLKDRIKRKKDELADTTRMFFPRSAISQLPIARRRARCAIHRRRDGFTNDAVPADPLSPV